MGSALADRLTAQLRADTQPSGPLPPVAPGVVVGLLAQRWESETRG